MPRRKQKPPRPPLTPPVRLPARNLPAGFFLTDSARTPEPLAAIARLPRGYGVIYRHYDFPARRELGQEIARLCRTRHLLFLVAGDIALAHDIGADGLHLPEWLAQQGRPHALPVHWMLTVAAHSPRALRQAAVIRADAALAGPAFPSPSHPGKEALGPHRLGRMLAAAQIPVYALGGVNRTTRRRLPTQMLAGVAGIGDFL